MGIRAHRLSFMGNLNFAVSQGDEHVAMHMRLPTTNYTDNQTEIDLHRAMNANSGRNYQHTDVHGPVEGGYQQLGLMGATHLPPVIDSLYATSGGSHLVGTALGIAAQTAQRRFGETPIPDENLSKHSSRIVQKLIDKGALPSNISSAKQNNVEKGVASDEDARRVAGEISSHWYARTVPEHEMASARDYVRNLLRGKKTAPSEAQFGQVHPDQGTLF